jgi:hypothetical protein
MNARSSWAVLSSLSIVKARDCDFWENTHATCNAYEELSRMQDLRSNYNVSYFRIRGLNIITHLCIACFNYESR